MVRIIIKNTAELRALQSKIKLLKSVLPTLQKNAMDAVSKTDVIDEIHSQMRLNDFSEKIIDATSVGRTELSGSILRTHFISNYVSDTGFDVSKGREEGTASGVLRKPKKPGGSLRWFGKSGEPIFRKWSRPKGIERLLIIEKTLAKAKNQAVTQYQEHLASSVTKFLGV